MAGFLFIIFACAFWALDTLIRYPLMQGGFNAVTLVFYEHLLLTVIFSVVFFKSLKKVWEAKTSHYFYFFMVGGVGSALATVAFSRAFMFLNPSLVILLQKFQPLVVILLARVVLKEQIKKALEKAGFSKTLRPFVSSVSSIVLKGAILFAVATLLGADLTGLVAILAAAGFAIGMALQGSLGNFASGLIVLSLKPYKVGDWIQIDDKFGKVEEIGVFNTKVISPGNKTLIIPNSKITDDVVTNYSEKGMIRLEIDVTMPYEESFPKIKSIIGKALSTIPLILKDPQPEIGIENFEFCV